MISRMQGGGLGGPSVITPGLSGVLVHLVSMHPIAALEALEAEVDLVDFQI